MKKVILDNRSRFAAALKRTDLPILTQSLHSRTSKAFLLLSIFFGASCSEVQPTDIEYLQRLSEDISNHPQQVCFVPEQITPTYYAELFFPGKKYDRKAYESEGYWFVLSNNSDEVIIIKIDTNNVNIDINKALCVNEFKLIDGD